jgi:hypothetical protein
VSEPTTQRNGLFFIHGRHMVAVHQSELASYPLGLAQPQPNSSTFSRLRKELEERCIARREQEKASAAGGTR